MLTEEHMQKIQERLDSYYETNEIDIDLANYIHNDASCMLRVVRQLQKHNKLLVKGLGDCRDFAVKYDFFEVRDAANSVLQQIQGKEEENEQRRNTEFISR